MPCLHQQNTAYSSIARCVICGAFWIQRQASPWSCLLQVTWLGRTPSLGELWRCSCRISIVLAKCGPCHAGDTCSLAMQPSTIVQDITDGRLDLDAWHGGITTPKGWVVYRARLYHGMISADSISLFFLDFLFGFSFLFFFTIV
jgi:hypothetical protein